MCKLIRAVLSVVAVVVAVKIVKRVIDEIYPSRSGGS